MISTYNSNVVRPRSSFRRNRNFTNSRVSTTSLGPISTTFLLIIIVGVLALLYLTQVTKTSVYGYEVNSLTTERQDLIERKQELEVEAARLQSIARIRDNKAVGSLQPEQQVKFTNAN